MIASERSRVPADTEQSSRDLQDRLARFARFVFILEIPMFTVGRVLTALGPGLSLRDFAAPQRVPQEISIVLLFTVWRRCRGAPLSQPVLEAIDAALTFVLCASWAMFGFGASGGFPTVMSMTLAVTYSLVIRSVVVPSSFSRTLWIGVASSLPTIAIIVIYGMSFAPPGASVQQNRVFLVFAVVWCVVAASVSAVISRTLYGLRQQIREAGKLGQYTLEEKIGEGGMGVVHRATHAMLRRPAAIKLLVKERAGEKDLARFEREVQHTSRLAHPNTISIFDYGRTAEGVFYYVMEYLDGLDLDRLVDAEGPIDPGRAIHILVQASGALAEAHALGLIHRDIKPANIVLTDRVDAPDVVKVVDFGLVKTLEANVSDSTAGEVIVGTPMYLAPEAIATPSTVDARADLYALGAVAYYLVTGKHVFEAATMMEMCSMHLIQQPIAPSERLGRPLPADLEALVLACLEKDRDARPASAAVLRDSLLRCADACAYDADAARAWWRHRGAELRTRRQQVGKGLEAATTMAIDLRGRDAER